MKSLKDFPTLPAKIESEKKEIVQESSEIEVAEISNGQLEQHAGAANAHIDQQTAEILPESRERIESSAQSVRMSAESLTATRQRYGIDAQLQEIQNEANQIAGDAKAKIASITGEPQPEKVAETKEQPPEEFRGERRIAIVKELEKEWGTKNGPMDRPLSKSTGRLSEIFKKAGLESRIVKIENGGEFSEAIIFDKKEASPEKMVRLYRGVNHLDASVLEQIPYAMRTESGTGKPTALESVRQEVDTLAKNPTYENLLAYTDKVRQYLSPKEVRRLDEDLARIEDGILRGYSTRTELVMKQIEHSGGWGESGISPYISTSFDPHEAASYGNKGLIIMDVPLSQIEGFGIGATEAKIKGTLDKKYITAILPRERDWTKEKEELNKEIYRALQKVYEAVPANLYGEEELRAERERKLTEETESDKEQWKKDVEAVRQKRVAKLAKRFPEVKFDLQNLTEQGVDIYTKAKRDVFDYYKTRLEKIGRNGRNIEDYEYQEPGYGQKKFDREKASDIMLLKLKVLVEMLEEKEEERSRRK